MHTTRLTLLTLSSVLAFLVITLALPSAWAQNVGDRVLLVERAIGVPGHPAPGNPGVSHRFPGGTTVTVTAIDAPTGWFQVEDETGNSAWITRRYIAQVLAAGPPPSGLCYQVGTWNLEHFHEGRSRVRRAGDHAAFARCSSIHSTNSGV